MISTCVFTQDSSSPASCFDFLETGAFGLFLTSSARIPMISNARFRGCRPNPTLRATQRETASSVYIHAKVDEKIKRRTRTNCGPSWLPDRG